jgi:hypothetical protein
MPNEGFRGVSLKSELVDELEKFVLEYPVYHSVAEFVAESVRSHMTEIREQKKRAR